MIDTPVDWLELNLDGSKWEEGAAIGGIIQNYLGYGIRGYSRNCGSVSSNEVEVLDLLWGVKLGKGPWEFKI